VHLHDHIWERAAGARVAGERRLNKRYALDLPLSYRIGKEPFIVTGRGRTVDMSSGGIAFTTDEHLNVGAHLQLSISWPMLLNETCALKLVVDGKLVRKTENRAAIVINRIEFRTRGRVPPR
jgi:hypothetical protein